MFNKKKLNNYFIINIILNLLYNHMIIDLKSFTNNKESISVTVCYDDSGNLYLKHKMSYYFLTINGSDDLQFFESLNVEKLITAHNLIKFKPLKNSNDETSLKGKILNTIEENDNDNNNDDECYDVMNEEDIYGNIKKLHPEKKYYYHDEDEDMDDNEIYNNEGKFNFYKSGNMHMLEYLNVAFDAPANYDTLVMNPHTKSVIMSLECSDGNDYAVIVYTDGQFDLNIIGSKRKSFKFNYYINSDDELIINTEILKVKLIT